jgi:hypothetical protein
VRKNEIEQLTDAMVFLPNRLFVAVQRVVKSDAFQTTNLKVFTGCCR